MSRWWSWPRGKREAEKLEESRLEALSTITGERSQVEVMAQRPRRADDALSDADKALLEGVLKRLGEIEERAKQASNTDDLDDLVEYATEQGAFSAYLCPQEELRIEGNLAFELMEWWGVPKSEVSRLRGQLAERLDKAEDNPAGARSALHTLFAERNAWEEYRDDYEGAMRLYATWLFGATLILPATAVVTVHYAFHFAPLLTWGLLLAGAAGSCVSVLTKLPALEVCLSEKIDSYDRRILSRVGVGTVASLIGCGLLGSGLIHILIQGQTFGDVLNDCSAPCSTSTATPCTALRTLILLAIPMLFGFSERALTSFEEQAFGKRSKSRTEG